MRNCFPSLDLGLVFDPTDDTVVSGWEKDIADARGRRGGGKEGGKAG